jgi:hypothetical protein
MNKQVPPLSWAQLTALVTLLAGTFTGVGAYGNSAMAAATPAPTPAAVRHLDDVLLVDALNNNRVSLDKMQATLEKLDGTVRELSTKVAVLEDRSKRSTR